jgi:hypothetical protein
MSKQKHTWKDERFIYNLKQAEFFIKNGAEVQRIGVHPTTRRTFFLFKFSTTIEQMTKWVENGELFKSKEKEMIPDGKSINS